MTYVDSKKAVLAIYEILKKYSSKENPLSNVKIGQYFEKIKSEYDWNSECKISRNTIKDTLAKLQEFYGEDVICCERKERKGANGQENSYTFRYYFNRDKSQDILSDKEIVKLIEMSLSAKNLTAEEAKKLMERLQKMMTKEQKDTVKYIDDIPIKQFNTNKEISNSLEILRTAIAKNREQSKQWVTFDFNYYNEKKQLVPRKNKKEGEKEKPRKYRVLPLRIHEVNHKYYLICAMEKGDDYKLYHYRIDLMTDLKVDMVKKTVGELEDLKKRLSAENVSDYISTHLYMFYDEPTRIIIEIPKIGEEVNLTFLVDAFGVGDTWKVIGFKNDNIVKVQIKCSPKAMKIFLMQYADKNIRVVAPDDVKEQINKELRESCEKILRAVSEKKDV